MSEAMTVQEIYEARIHVTQVVDFGLELQAVVSRRVPIPPHGLRVNASFEGEVKGPRLSGRITGVDYLTLKPDGIAALNIEGVIETGEGERVAMHGGGIIVPPPGSPVGQLRENVTLYSASSRYSWVNRLQCWATGTVDLSTGEIAAKLFAA
jgi:Protein of unknown function (DUF3237)